MYIDDQNDKQVNYLDLRLEIINKTLTYKIYDKRDHFNFPIVNFPNLNGNIPRSHSYGVFTAQLIRYARGCKMYNDFKDRTQLLFNRLIKQGFKRSKYFTHIKNF